MQTQGYHLRGGTSGSLGNRFDDLLRLQLQQQRQLFVIHGWSCARVDRRFEN